MPSNAFGLTEGERNQILKAAQFIEGKKPRILREVRSRAWNCIAIEDAIRAIRSICEDADAIVADAVNQSPPRDGLE